MIEQNRVIAEPLSQKLLNPAAGDAQRGRLAIETESLEDTTTVIENLPALYEAAGSARFVENPKLAEDE
jgi:hypothetical protein